MDAPELDSLHPQLPLSSPRNAQFPLIRDAGPTPAPEQHLPSPSLASASNSGPNDKSSSLETSHDDARLSPARARTPITTTTAPRPMTPHGMPAGNADGTPLLGPAVPRSPDSNRPLNVTDALSYLDAVKMQFNDKPDVYNHFLDIMKDFKSQVIDTPGVIERVSMLFHGNPYLIQGFNTFLPPGYRIEISTDPRNMDTILVTTPGGTTSHKLSTYGADMRGSREAMLSGMGGPSPDTQPQFGFPPPPVLPIGIGSGSRPVTPNSRVPPLTDMQHGAQTTAAASFLGNLGNHAVEKSSGEFNHAMEYLNKIKERFQDRDVETYKQFLEILQTYQKEQKHLHDSQVYVQVQMLFKDAPDLMDEFRDFLPAVVGPSSQNAGLIGILPNPSGSWGQTDTPVPEKATKAPRRRKRPAEKDAAGASKAAGRSAKRARTNQKPEPQSPKFSPYQVPSSPPPIHPHGHPQSGGAPHPQTTHTHALQPTNVVQNVGGPSTTTPEELLFFDRTKRVLEMNGTYEEFLKLLNLYSRDVIATKTLIEHAERFLDVELMSQFKELLGWDDKQGRPEYGPPGSIRTGPPDPSVPRADSGQGPSYRHQPESEIHLACSGRDQLCWSVLNDEWYSHPTWASEEAGFVAHKKNTHEDVLSKSEEERHEWQVHIDALSRTIAVLDPLEARLEEMSAEERAQFRLHPGLGGPSRTIYERIIKKVYGRDAGNEVMRVLQENPSVAVPVVLARLRQKDDDWRRTQREFNRTWRDYEAKNFYKALDHQSAAFKTNDKKFITTKHFVLDIEGVKEKQAAAYEAKGEKAFAYGSVGPQFQFQFEDTAVLQDSVKLIYSFLDHSPSVYSPAERRSVEGFLRQFIPVLFMFSNQDFNAACGRPLGGHEEDTAGDSLAGGDGADEGHRVPRDRSGKRQTSGGQSTAVSAKDLRKRLLKTAQERSPQTKLKELPSRSAALTRSTSPAASESSAGAPRPKGSRLHQELGVDDELRCNPADIWIREAVTFAGSAQAGEAPVARRPFFANTTFYALLRLLQVLYSRLLACKEVGARDAARKHASLLANPVAIQLGLDEPNGPSAILAQAVEAFGDGPTGDDPNVLYLYLLAACDKVFVNNLDQATFEEQMRWFFGTKAYLVFTLDRVITAIIKQVQTILVDNKCQELWQLLQKARSSENISAYDTIRYRREAERHAASDDHLYGFDWNRETRTLRVQLVGAEDPSIEEDFSARGRWQEYVASYVMVHPTERVPAGGSTRSAVFLKRSVMDAAEKGDTVTTEMGMAVQVRAKTYQLVYEGGSEDVLFRWRSGEEDAVLRARTAARDEERRRRLGRWLIQRGGVGPVIIGGSL